MKKGVIMKPAHFTNLNSPINCGDPVLLTPANREA